ncbi:hypothetical protein JDXMQMMX_CDS75 [Acinetobacter phage vB_AbaM_AB4P2]|nr:hypothetical protein JDXMQMMX_CDS75 [Acinetobacter phage vB_AbaM_AB4P2]
MPPNLFESIITVSPTETTDNPERAAFFLPYLSSFTKSSTSNKL